MVNKTGQYGFTLVEIIIAITIGALMTTAAYQALKSAVGSVQQVNDVTEKLNNVDRVFQLLSADFNHAVNRPWVDVYAQQQPAFQALFGDRLAQSDAALTSVNSYIIRLVRSGWDNPLERQRSNLQLVGYRITEDDRNTAKEAVKKTLWRDSWPVIDTADVPRVKQRRLLDGVKELRMRFLPSGVDNVSDDDWITGWPPRTKRDAPLPLAVEVVLTVEGMGEITRIFMFAQTP